MLFWASTLLLGIGVAEAQLDPLDFVASVPITDNNPGTQELGRDRVSINSTPFKNQSILTSGDYQFTTYYRDDGRLLIARRNLTTPAAGWDIRATNFTSFNINDAHNVPVLGLDGDGYLHVSWGMHNNNLLYTKSTAPVTTGAPLSFVGDTIGNSAAINTMTGSNETSVTYPNFLSIPGTDDLLFNYRTGGSGNGIYRISRYDTSSGTWSFTDENWIERTDSSGLTYNAYPHNMSYDPSGGLHASWTFRYNSSSPTGHSGYQTNHNLMYSYSPDDGVTWYRDINGTIPYTGVINDMTAEVAVPIPEGSSLINTGTQSIDTHGRPSIGTWWAPRAQDATPDHRRQYMFVGHDGSDWFTSQITHRLGDNPNVPVPESQLGVNHMGRPQIVFDDYNRAYVIFKDADRGGGVTVAYSQAESRDDWEFIELSSTNLGYYEPTIDLDLWNSSRQLHVLVQTIDGNSGNGGSQMSMLQWDAASAMGRVLKWSGQANATWDTTAVNFVDLQSPDNFDSFDNVTFDDSAAQKNINFAGNVNAGKVVVDSSQAYTFSGAGGMTSGSLAVVGGGMLDLATSGNSYTGPTRVSNATLKITGNANAMVSRVIAADGGTVVMDAQDATGMASEFEVWPTGVLEIGTATSTGQVFPQNPTGIFNDGTVRTHQDANLQNMSGMGSVEAVSGTTTLRNNPTYAGSITIATGAVGVVSNNTGLGASGGVARVLPGGQMRIGFTGTVAKAIEVGGDGGGAGAVQVPSGHDVTFSNTVTLSSNATFDIADASQAIIAPAITGPGGLTKKGPGTLRLSGANSYAGPTVVSGGTLVVEAATGLGNTTVESSGALEAAGVVRGNLIAEAGALVRVTDYAGPPDGTVYEERFTGNASTPLSGRAPDTVSGNATWAAHSSIRSDGLGVSVAGGSSATLPIDIQEGFTYTLDATFQNVAGDEDWLAVGFLEDVMNGGTSNANRFILEPTAGKAWMLFRGSNSSSANQALLGSDTNGTADASSWSTFNTNGGDIHVRLVLDTTGGAGNYTAEFLAKQPTDLEYTQVTDTLPLLDEDISAVGFAVSNASVMGDVDFFRLDRMSAFTADPQALTINGDFTLHADAVLSMEYLNGQQHDRVVVDGTLGAFGTLLLAPAEGASALSAGDALDLLDFASLTGTLQTLILPALPTGLEWDNSQVLTDGTLQVVVGLAGDFNDDGIVNSIDYAVWRESLGASGTGLQADANSDLIVDELDFQVWTSEFGATLPALASLSGQVPEPSAWALWLAACLTGVRRGSRQADLCDNHADHL